VRRLAAREPQSRSTIDPIRPAPIRSSASSATTGAASAFPADISDVTQTHQLVGPVFSESGRLDLLVSNAGVEHFAVDRRAWPPA
jgi:NAD(P)-dependent dehydrogenase (short-subunit alcohol dehydrogenase family)